MAEVRWTPQALEDLEGVADFIAQDSPHHATVLDHGSADRNQGIIRPQQSVSTCSGNLKGGDP